MDAKECRFCKHYSTLGLPEGKGACMKSKRRVGMFNTCKDFRANISRELMEGIRKALEN